MPHTSEVSFWHLTKSQHMYKERIIKLKKQIIIQGPLKLYTS